MQNNNLEEIQVQNGKLYSLSEIKEEYNIESDAFNALLCSKKNDESMVLFYKIAVETEKGKEIYYYK